MPDSRSYEGCPQRHLHVLAEPEGYITWHEWAEQMSKTHDQKQCPGCGLWKIWEPKAPDRGN